MDFCAHWKPEESGFWYQPRSIVAATISEQMNLQARYEGNEEKRKGFPLHVFFV